MLTPEGKVKEGITALLKSYERDHGLWYYMPVPTGYGKSALDYICAVYGTPFAVEAKAPGKKLTPRQELTAAAMLTGGVKVFVVDGPVKLLELSKWLEQLTNRFI